MLDRKEVRLEVKVRNNLVLSAMEQRGIATVAELCRQMGLPRSEVAHLGSFINMKKSARKKDGGWRMLALKLSDFFQCMPEDLFADFQQYAALERQRTHAEISFAELQQLTARCSDPPTPEQMLAAEDLRRAVARMLSSLTARQERVLRMRFGFDDGRQKTHEEIAGSLGLTGAYVSQIETKALRKLKHPSRIKHVLDAASVTVMRQDFLGEVARKTHDTFDGEVLDAL